MLRTQGDLARCLGAAGITDKVRKISRDNEVRQGQKGKGLPGKGLPRKGLHQGRDNQGRDYQGRDYQGRDYIREGNKQVPSKVLNRKKD